MASVPFLNGTILLLTTGVTLSAGCKFLSSFSRTHPFNFRLVCRSFSPVSAELERQVEICLVPGYSGGAGSPGGAPKC